MLSGSFGSHSFGIQAAMKKIGFLKDEIGAVYRLVAAILHLGNIEFAEAFKKGMDTVTVSNKPGTTSV